jgi:hypothetical protein
LEILKHLGLPPPRFRHWIPPVLSSYSLRVLQNNILGDLIKHGRGLQQGDALSPLLFDIVVVPLQHTLQAATDPGLLHDLLVKGARF